MFLLSRDKLLITRDYEKKVFIQREEVNIWQEENQSRLETRHRMSLISGSIYEK